MTDPKPIRVLIVDDEVDAREWLAEWLRRQHKFEVETAGDSASAQERVSQALGNFDAALIDLDLGVGPDGLETMKQIHAQHPDIGVIIITGFGDVELGVRAMLEGAIAYVTKPLNRDEVVVYIRAAADRKRIKLERDRLRTERDWLEILSHVSKAFSVATLDLKEIANAVYRETVHLIPNAEVFYLALYDSETDELTFELAIEEGAPQQIAPRKLTDASENWGLTGWVVKKKAPLQINDISSEALPTPSFTFGKPARRARSYLGFPLISRNQVVGVVSAQCYEPSAFKPEHRQFLEAVANQAATVIDNARLHRATQETDAELKLLLETTNAVAGAQSVDEGLSIFAKKMVTDLGVTFCHIMLRNDRTPQFEIKAAFPNGGEAGNIDIQWNPATERFIDLTSMTTLADLTYPRTFRAGDKIGDQVVLDHFKQHTHFTSALESILVMPLTVSDRKLGVCTLGESRAWENSPFTDKRIALAESLARQAALLIDRFRAHEATADKLAEVRRLGDITEALVQSVTDSPKEILDKVAQATCEIVGADSVIIFAFDQAKRSYSDIAHSGLQTATPFTKRAREDSLRAMVRRFGTVIVDDLARGQDRQGQRIPENKPDDWTVKEGIRAFVGIALQAGQDQLGVMFVNFTQPHPFLEDEIEMITRLANQAAVAIQKSGFIQEIRAEASDLRQGLHQVTGQISSLRPLDETLRTVADGIQQVVGSDLVTVHLYDDERQRYPRLVASAGEFKSSPAQQDRTTVQSSPIFQHLLDDPAPHFAEHIRDDKVMRVSLFAKKEKIRSCAGIVLRANNRPLGFLFVNYRRRHHFSESEQAAFHIFADQAAIFIDNARLYEETRRQSEHRQMLLDANKAIVQGGFAGDSKQVMEQIARLSVERMSGPDGPKPTVGIIQLYDPVTNTLSFESIYPPQRLGDMKLVAGERRSLDRKLARDGKVGITGCAVLEKKTLRISNVRAHPDYISATTSTQSELATPLLEGDRVIGVLSVESDKEGAFDLKDEQALQGLADFTVVAIKSAQQSEELSRSNAIAVLGAWGADVVHTINREVGNIRRALFPLLERADLPGDAKTRLREIDEYADRIGLPELPENPPTPGQAVELRDAPDLAHVLASEVSRFQTSYPDFAFRAEPPPNPVRVAMREQFLRQLVRHLIHNSINHTRDMAVRQVTLRTVAHDTFVEIQVEDTGTGIRPQIESEIFCRPIAHNERDRGSGRGLLLVDFITKQHGGHARIVRNGYPDRGACFGFSVPLASTAPSA